jgi:HAD superfamily hydrolase (TIGR01509 family)
MAILAVIFDIDGLMIDSERVSQRSWGQVMGAAGYVLNDAVYCRMIGRTEKDVKFILQEVYGVEFPFEEMYQRREEQFLKIISSQGIPVKPGLIELLNWIDAQKLKKAVASSTYRKLAEMKLEAAGIRGYFEQIVTGDEVLNGKPAPDLFLAAARKIAVEPEHCVVLEDSHAGIQSAHAAGMRSILVPDMQPVDEGVARLAYRTVASLHDVIGVIPQMG